MSKIKIGNGISEKFLMGSNYFFSSVDGFIPKDTDYCIFVDEPIMFKDVMKLKGNDEEVFFWRKMQTDEFIKYALNSNVQMQSGKFLVKEICDYIGFGVEDLKQLEHVFECIDDKHKYEKVIYDSYIKNNAFKLTKRQLNKAYKEYIKCRQ